MNQLILSLFPGIGLLDRAFEEEGFCVVRGPDLLWGGDIKSFHPLTGRFDGIIGGPPCQAFSRLQALVAHNRRKAEAAGDFRFKPALNLIPEYERCVSEAAPQWFLMENVPDAPAPVVPGYIVQSVLINNRWVGGVQNRVRRFSFGWWQSYGHGEAPVFRIETEAMEPTEYAPAVTASGGRWVPVAIGGSGKGKISKHLRGYLKGGASSSYLADAIRLQGLPEGFLSGSPLTVRGKCSAIGNGVPLPLGRAVARAVRKILEMQNDKR